jgi:WD40 repeat protein
MNARPSLCFVPGLAAMLCGVGLAAEPPKPAPMVAIVSPVPGSAKQLLALPVQFGSNKVQTGAYIHCLVTFGPAVPIGAVAFSPDGKTLATGGHQEIVLWDLVEPKLSKRIGAGQLTGNVHALAYTPDGKFLVAGEGTPSVSGAVRIFDAASGQVAASLDGPKDEVYGLAFSPDGKLLAAASADKAAYVWNMDDKKLVATLKDHTDWVLGVAFSADGKLLATASADKTAQAWEVGTWKSATRLFQNEAVHAVAFAPDVDAMVMAVGGPSDRAIRTRRRDNTQQIRVTETAAGMPLDLVWGPKPEKPPATPRMFAPCSDNALRVLNAQGYVSAVLTGHADWVYSAAGSPDGVKAASGSADGTVKLWNVAENRLLATLVQLAPRSDDWLIVTAQGFLAGSSPGGVAWKTFDVPATPEKLNELFQKPEQVKDAFTGKRINPVWMQ